VQQHQQICLCGSLSTLWVPVNRKSFLLCVKRQRGAHGAVRDGRSALLAGCGPCAGGGENYGWTHRS
jgi:hypothetical protein